jgi:hypothetical protein
MKIVKFEIVDRCLFWKEKKTLIVGDLHLGYESSINEEGVAIPKNQMKENYELFRRIFKKTGNVKKIILLGDVKHYFGKVLEGESNDFVNLVYFFRDFLLKDGKIIITKGNHDNILEKIVENYKDVELVSYLIEEGVLFFHGDSKSLSWVSFNLFDKKIKLVVKGHFHPAAVLTDGSKKEKYKCFVYGSFNKKKTIIVPSFFPFADGWDVFSHDKLEPKGLEESSFFIIGDFDKLYKMKGKKLKENAHTPN